MSIIFYGVEGHYVNVTAKCLELAQNSDYIEIPKTDFERCALFGDPAYERFKHILVINDGKFAYFDIGMILRLPKSDISTRGLQKQRVNVNIADEKERLADLHSRVVMAYGNIREEFEEQLMAVKFIQPHYKVLELGSNVGRNSVLISSILDDDQNLVTLESDPSSVKHLYVNKILNNLQFNIENAALAKQQLIQSGWNTIPSNEILPGYYRVNSITLQQIEDKYKFEFDVLVADCEGALFYILQDFPELLKKSFKYLLVENDYYKFEHKQFVDKCFKENGFERVYFRPGGFGDCKEFFWEAWQRVEK